MFSGSRTYSKTGKQSWEYILIVGQSNAVGLGLWDDPVNGLDRITMLGNDYVWKRAYEPTDDVTDQVDTISKDGAGVIPGNGEKSHSAWLKAAVEICKAHPEKKICLIPCAKGSTTFRSTLVPSACWAVPSSLTDRTTLWGSAYYRAMHMMNWRRYLSAIWFIGHESSIETSYGGSENLLSTYYDDFLDWASNWRSAFGNVPIVFGQLGPNDSGSSTTPATPDETHATNLWLNYHVGRNLALTGESAIPNSKMVVCFDQGLNSADPFHINRAGQNAIGNRFALAHRQLVYGDSVNGTGPRPVSIQYIDTTTLQLTLDKDIVDTTSGDYDSQFQVISNLGNHPISAAARYDDSLIWIFTSTSMAGYTWLALTYGQTKRNTALTDPVVDSDGMPLPGFWMQI